MRASKGLILFFGLRFNSLFRKWLAYSLGSSSYLQSLIFKYNSYSQDPLKGNDYESR